MALLCCSELLNETLAVKKNPQNSLVVILCVSLSFIDALNNSSFKRINRNFND